MRDAAAIHDHAIIGDGRSAALVTRGGAIDWLCWTRFDSPPIFGALLDPVRGGVWRIAPTGHAHVRRAYADGSNVLETTFETATGRAVLTDLMTIASERDKRHLLVPDHELLRRVACVDGEVELEIHVEPRPDFGRARMKIADLGRLGLRWEIGRRLLTLRSEVPLRLGDDGVARAVVRMSAGDAFTCSLTYDEESPAVLPPLGGFALDSIARTNAWWRAWIARARYDGPFRPAVMRSALVLKLLAFAPSGAMIAAPTTSLPERPGGALNWDYRFAWLRDASFTARALLSLGYVDDADAFCNWLLHTTRLTRPALRNVYDVFGNRPPDERERPGLAGYRGARPVRTGVAIGEQLQLDCYGEVIDATTQLLDVTGSVDGDTARLLRDFGGFVRRHWRDLDQGIWEPRGAPQARTHSRLLCWTALDRLLDLDRRGLIGLGGDRDAIGGERAAIRADIETNGWDPIQQAYTGVYGDRELDAAVLLLTWYGFHPGGSPRMKSTFARIRERLGCAPGLYYRYEDSLRGREGAFWICSFWAAEHLAMGGGTLEQARGVAAAAQVYASDLGLMAEEVDPRDGTGLGNFPQAYTHVGLINAALSIAERARQVREAAA